ncbi:MAG: hypothetical protein GY938_25780 [Ketobacter sp.]|nr:hypothetical protein [Ketobacter sp.]
MNVLDYAKPIEKCPVCSNLLDEGHSLFASTLLDKLHGKILGPFNEVERVPGSVQYFEDELDIDHELYYYIRDADNFPLITVCLLISADGFVARGIAICSPIENPEKSIGRGWARDRAYDAMYEEADDEPIKTQIAKYIFYVCDVSVPKFKQQFNPELSNFEKNVLLRKGLKDQGKPVWGEGPYERIELFQKVLGKIQKGFE